MKIFHKKYFLFDQTKKFKLPCKYRKCEQRIDRKNDPKTNKKNTSLEFHRDVCHIKLQCPI